MRKIMLLMSIICLTAMAAGCEENGMVVLMCDKGGCPEDTGNAAEKPVTGEGTPCDDAEYLKICNGNSYLYCNNGMTAFQSCRENQICKTGEGCVGNAKPLCGPKDRCDGGSCECPEEQTCENGTCKPPKCKENDSCETCRCDAPLVCNGDKKCLKPICTKDLECPQACNCPEGQVCDENRCTENPTTGNPPSLGEKCREDGTCEDANKVCVDGKCLFKCKSNERCDKDNSRCVCDDGMSCGENGKCVFVCNEDNDCENGRVCVDYVCVESKCKSKTEISKKINGEWKDFECNNRCAINTYGKAVCVIDSSCDGSQRGYIRCSGGGDLRYCDGNSWAYGGDCSNGSCSYEYNEVSAISKVVCNQEETSSSLINYQCAGDVLRFCISGDWLCFDVLNCSDYGERCNGEKKMCEK